MNAAAIPDAEVPPFLIGLEDAVPCTAVPEIFAETINGDGRKVSKAAINEAKLHCGPCPVRQACGQFALDTNQVGVWGGSSGAERIWMRRKGLRRVA